MQRFLITLMFVAAAAAAAAWTGVYLSIPSGSDKQFVVAVGENADQVARRLRSEGHIRSANLFKLAIRDSGLATKFQPGSYDLRGADSYLEIAQRLTTGGLAPNEMIVRVIEGWTLAEIRAHLEKNGYAAVGDFYGVTGEPAKDYRKDMGTLPADLSAEFDFLKDKPAYVSLEGFLFPDTYRVYRDAPAKDLVRLLLANFGKKMTPELRTAAARQGRTLFDVVTMASVIEREVRGDEDRRKVSDIFWRRLDVGMPLQADSTVNYVTGKDLASVTFEDTDIDSRYNTYKIPGLPLGPICNPGLSALTAAVTPLANDYWYFLTDEDGGVHYAATLDGHNQNKARYLK